jgi:molybdopterin-containing oxidoreductase family membrane subunit
MLFCNCLSPQLFWFKWCRRNVFVVFFVCMCVNAGMWFERFIIIAGGLIRDFLPSSWRVFHPTWVDIWTYLGTIGIFTSLFLIFIRFLPMIAMSEVKTAVPEADPHFGARPTGKEPTR